MFLILLSYIKPLEEIDQWIPKHLEFLDRNYERNVFIVSGRRIPRVGGLILINVEKEEEVRRIISEDPFYQNQLAEYNIIEFTPTKCDSRFSCFVNNAS